MSGPSVGSLSFSGTLERTEFSLFLTLDILILHEFAMRIHLHAHRPNSPERRGSIPGFTIRPRPNLARSRRERESAPGATNGLPARVNGGRSGITPRHRSSLRTSPGHQHAGRFRRARQAARVGRVEVGCAERSESHHCHHRIGVTRCARHTLRTTN